MGVMSCLDWCQEKKVDILTFLSPSSKTKESHSIRPVAICAYCQPCIRYRPKWCIRGQSWMGKKNQWKQCACRIAYSFFFSPPPPPPRPPHITLMSPNTTLSSAPDGTRGAWTEYICALVGEQHCCTVGAADTNLSGSFVSGFRVINNSVVVYSFR